MAAILTRSEQRLAQIKRLKRPLTDDESAELYRCLHAVYVRNRRLQILAQHDKEQAQLLARVEAESRMPERYVEHD